LQITVNAAVVAPSALSYPQTAITGTVGQPIAPNIPSFTGSVTSFTISPALPAGMSLNTLNGTISGTPAAVLAQASYTVTASNAGGNTTAALTLVVDKAYATVLELGHADRMTTMRSTTDRLLSQDRTGHWALWDAVADSELASGDQYFPDLKPFGNVWDVDLAGPTVAIGQPNGLEIRSSLDGHLLSIIAAPKMIDLPYTDSTKKGSWWKLASDGSYICAGSAAGLSIWSPGGQQLVVKQGDYSSASVFAAPGQVQVALGAAGQNVIETINIGNGASAVGPAFSGTFNAWFLDGQRFLTNTGNTVWTYSAASVQQGIVSLPSIQNLAGQGNWISTYSGQIAIYAVGASTPSATYQISGATVVPSGMTLGIIINPGDGSGSVVDLSGSAPVKTDFTTPFAYLSAYTATSASKWFAGNVHGVIVDGASANAARALSLGQAWSIAGGTTKAAISTANGSITYLNPATPAAVNTIAFSSSKLALSTDDTVLAALANSNDFQYQTDRTLNVYSLPSGTTTISFPYSFSSGTYLLDFSLSGSGSVLGQILSTSSRTVSATTGGTPIWSDTFNPASSPIGSLLGSLQISPDGTLIAAASGPLSDTVGTNIYKNGALVTAVPGWPLAWLDDSRLLVKSYTAPLGRTFPYTYASSAVYDSSGAKLATPAIPELLFAQPVGSGQIYSSDKNSVFSLATGSATWTGGLPSTAGAVAGQYVIFAKGSKVFLDAY
jgi:hypothetical protein